MSTLTGWHSNTVLAGPLAMVDSCWEKVDFVLQHLPEGEQVFSRCAGVTAVLPVTGFNHLLRSADNMLECSFLQVKK